MLIQFKVDAELEIVENYDEENEVVDASNETFKAGDQHDVELLESHEDGIDIQFGDGSCAFCVPKAIVQRVVLHDFPVVKEPAANVEIVDGVTRRYNIVDGQKVYENTETGDIDYGFTVVHPDHGEETKIEFVQERTPHGPGPVHFSFEPGLTVDNQQMAELGAMFLALAGKDVDYSSCLELLDGYNLKLPEALEKALEKLDNGPH